MDRFAYLVTSDGYGTSLKEVQAITFGSPSTHTWYFVCGGYDGANAWISVNAGARDTVPFTADIFDSTNALRVGSGYNAEYVDGLVRRAGALQTGLDHQ